MTQAAVGLDFDEALDVKRDLLAEVAFDLRALLNDLTDAVELIFVERAHLRDGIDVGLGENLRGARVPDAKDVGEADAYLLVIRYVDSGNTCHGDSFSVALLDLAGNWGDGWRCVRGVQRKP